MPFKVRENRQRRNTENESAGKIRASGSPAWAGEAERGGKTRFTPLFQNNSSVSISLPKFRRARVVTVGREGNPMSLSDAKKPVSEERTGREPRRHSSKPPTSTGAADAVLCARVPQSLIPELSEP